MKRRRLLFQKRIFLYQLKIYIGLRVVSGPLRETYLKEQQLKNLENGNQFTDEDNKEDLLEVDESKQLRSVFVPQAVGSQERLGENTAKYLLNLHGSSAHYEPKSRSMREDTIQMRNSPGQALEFKEIHTHVWEASEKGTDVHLQAAPSQAEMLFKNQECHTGEVRKCCF
ncbi:hypothetical protein IFM89_028931 [Coptis chinensis]|uniref:Pre-mRNA-splicing factor SLU7 n=1 Tax=Coptis chinensis TaxID=261450 RepID=A0A835H974_9MAGN|nr:hypothetical protein IFM89_028931 [Coptis chinensis]